MNPSPRNSVIFVSAIYLFCLTLLCSCSLQSSSSSTYEKLLEYSEGIKVINTHEHQHRPDEFNIDTVNFYHLLHSTYLMQDLVSAGGKRLDMEKVSSLPLESQWDSLGAFLDYSRNTSYYEHFLKGFKKLYGFDEPYFTAANIENLSKKVLDNYTDYESWFDSAFRKAGFEIMFNDQYWNPFNVDIDTRHFALVFHINALVYDVCKKPAPGEDPVSTYNYARQDGHQIKDLEDYLEYCEFLFQKNKEYGAVCVKNSMAYGRNLHYEEVPYERAATLYQKPASKLITEEKKQMEDFMFHWIIQKAIEYDLPIQIHTGYLAGNGNYLKNGDPMLLSNLFMKYREAKFVLFHGGYPWTSQFVAQGKLFPNVYLDLVWLPQISRSKAVITLNEMLDCIPYNKIFWGGDCAFIEESVGSLEIGKSVIAETLAGRVDKGLLSEDMAFKIVEGILRNNAIEVFKLNYE